MATHKEVLNHVAEALDSELEFTVEPTTPEEFAAEYLRLERLMAPLKKRMGDMKKELLKRVPKDDTTFFDNGIKVIRTTHSSTHFMMEEFKKEKPNTYNEFLEDITKERVTISYIT